MLRLRVPDRFTLLGREWTVARPEQVSDLSDNTLGMCHGRDRLIEIIRAADGEAALEIFAHEFTHGGLWRSGLPDALDERVALAMEHVLIDFIRAVVEVEG